MTTGISISRWLLFVLIAVVWAGCETADNVDSPLEKYFVKLVGTDGNQQGVDLVVAKDRSIYLLGNTGSPDNGQQVYVARTNPAGIVLWTVTLGDINRDDARDIEILRDSTLAILSVVIDNQSLTRDFTITLLDNLGTIINTVTYGQPNRDEDAITISETDDSFIVSGSTDAVTNPLTNPADAIFVRFYKDLTVYSNVWQTQFGGVSDFDVAVKTVEVAPLFYVFGYSNRLEGGSSDAIADYNAFVWVLGASGGIPRNDFTIGNSMFANSDPAADERVGSVSVIPPQSGSGFLVTGYSSNSATNEQNIFALKIRRDIELIDNNNVDQIFQVPPRSDLGTPSSISASNASVFPSSGSGFFILGGDNTGGNNEDIYLKKLENNLADAWTSPPSFIFGGIGNDWPGAVSESPDGRIVILGTMVLGEVNGQQKIVLIKLSPDGKLAK